MDDIRADWKSDEVSKRRPGNSHMDNRFPAILITGVAMANKWTTRWWDFTKQQQATLSAQRSSVGPRQGGKSNIVNGGCGREWGQIINFEKSFRYCLSNGRPLIMRQNAKWSIIRGDVNFSPSSSSQFLTPRDSLPPQECYFDCKKSRNRYSILKMHSCLISGRDSRPRWRRMNWWPRDAFSSGDKWSVLCCHSFYRAAAAV